MTAFLASGVAAGAPDSMGDREVMAARTLDDLDLIGLAFRTDRRDADKITKGLHLHG